MNKKRIDINLLEPNITEEFIHSSGPGGQNINKVSSAVRLRFSLNQSNLFSTEEKNLLRQNLKTYINQQGEIIITARKSRSQDANRVIVREKLVTILTNGLYVPQTRIPTKPTKSSKRKRVDIKKLKGQIKKLRVKIRA